MPVWLIAFAAVAGALGSGQAGANAALGKAIGQVPAGLTSLIVSVASLVLLGVCLGGLVWPGAEKAVSVPWWGWLGGIMGAVMIAAQLFAAQQLGSALFAGIFVTASLVTSVALDHFGLMGFKQHTASWLRLGGIGLMLAGVFLVSRS